MFLKMDKEGNQTHRPKKKDMANNVEDLITETMRQEKNENDSPAFMVALLQQFKDTKNIFKKRAKKF